MHGMVAASASPREQGAAPEALAQEGEHDEDDGAAGHRYSDGARLGGLQQENYRSRLQGINIHNACMHACARRARGEVREDVTRQRLSVGAGVSPR